MLGSLIALSIVRSIAPSLVRSTVLQEGRVPSLASRERRWSENAIEIGRAIATFPPASSSVAIICRALWVDWVVLYRLAASKSEEFPSWSQAVTNRSIDCVVLLVPTLFRK